MAKKTSFKNLANLFQLSNGFASDSPIKKLKNGNYNICVLKSQTVSPMSGDVKTSWEYFETDSSGVVLRAPRGYAKYWKGVLIHDIEEAFQKKGQL